MTLICEAWGQCHSPVERAGLVVLLALPACTVAGTYSLVLWSLT